TSNTEVLSFGHSPQLATAAVHTGEVVTTGVSGVSHNRFGNFNKGLFFVVNFPVVISHLLRAYLLGAIIDGNFIKPYINAYLLILGAVILFKALKRKIVLGDNIKNAPYYAAFGGFLDAIGGGGWGPIVTSNLINKGNTPSS